MIRISMAVGFNYLVRHNEADFAILSKVFHPKLKNY